MLGRNPTDPFALQARDRRRRCARRCARPTDGATGRPAGSRPQRGDRALLARLPAQLRRAGGRLLGHRARPHARAGRRTRAAGAQRRQARPRDAAGASSRRTSSRCPRPGEHLVVLDGAGHPRAIVRNTHVELRHFNQIDDEFAFSAGEGDLTLRWWLVAHRQHWSEQAEREGFEIGEAQRTGARVLRPRLAAAGSLSSRSRSACSGRPLAASMHDQAQRARMRRRRRGSAGAKLQRGCSTPVHGGTRCSSRTTWSCDELLAGVLARGDAAAVAVLGDGPVGRQPRRARRRAACTVASKVLPSPRERDVDRGAWPPAPCGRASARPVGPVAALHHHLRRVADARAVDGPLLVLAVRELGRRRSGRASPGGPSSRRGRPAPRPPARPSGATASGRPAGRNCSPRRCRARPPA